MSECLVMVVYGNGKDVILLNPERHVENGRKIGKKHKILLNNNKLRTLSI